MPPANSKGANLRSFNFFIIEISLLFLFHHFFNPSLSPQREEQPSFTGRLDLFLLMTLV